jgi:hypothetical protein
MKGSGLRIHPTAESEAPGLYIYIGVGRGPVEGDIPLRQVPAARAPRAHAAARRLAPLALAVLLASCAATSPGDAPASPPPGSIERGSNTELEMGMHQEARWAEAGLFLALTDVPTESRCPEGTNCVWAGNAVVELSATRNGQAETFRLRLGPAGSEDFVSDSVDRLGVRFEVVRLSPEPRAGQTTDKMSYRVKVRATIL